MPRALIARFGRTAAVHIVEQVEARVNAPRRPGFDGRVAGREINGKMGREFALDFLQQLGGQAGYGTPMRGTAGQQTRHPGAGGSGTRRNAAQHTGRRDEPGDERVAQQGHGTDAR